MERNENGYSNFLFGNRNRNVTQNGNGRCPGTGDIWRGDGNTNGNNIGGNTHDNMYGNMSDMNGNRDNMNSGMNGGMGCNNSSRNGGCLGGASSNCAQRQLAMVYSPYQCWRMLYSPEDALNHGCLFEELDKPLEEY